MVGGELSCQYGTESESLARVSAMLDGNHISLRVVHHGMDAWHLAITHTVDDQVLVGDVLVALIAMTIVCPVGHATLPVLLSIHVVDDFLSQGDGSAARSIELMYVVGLLHAHGVLWKPFIILAR